MERLSDNAIQIINDLHTERLDYNTEYLPLIDAANQLAAYEDTNHTPEECAAAFEELAAYKATGLTPDVFDNLCREMSKLRMSVGIGTYDGLYRAAELLELERNGKLVQMPFVAMVEQSMQGGKMKPQKDQRFNGRYAAVYHSPRWGCPLIDICGTPYNSEQATKRVAALKEQEANDGKQ